MAESGTHAGGWRSKLEGISIGMVEDRLEERKQTFERFVHEYVCPHIDPGHETLLGYLLLNDAGAVKRTLKKTYGNTAIHLSLCDVMNAWMDQCDPSPTWSDLVGCLEKSPTYKAFTRYIKAYLKKHKIDYKEPVEIAAFTDIITDRRCPCATKNAVKQFGILLDLPQVEQHISGAAIENEETGIDGLEIIKRWKESCPDDPVIKLVSAMERLLPQNRGAVQKLVDCILKLGVRPDGNVTASTMTEIQSVGQSVVPDSNSDSTSPKPEKQPIGESEPLEPIREEITKAYKERYKDICLDPSDISITVPAETFFLEIELTEVDDIKCRTCSLASYKDMFTKGDGPHRIALYAPAGCGKTCMCEMMAFCFATENSLGEKFDAVLFMKLRGHSLQDDVAQIVLQGAFPHKPFLKVTISELMERHKGKILFVLDGYDELVEARKPAEQGVYTLKNLFDDPSQSFVVSTRPTQLSELKNAVKINMKVRIKGLTEEQAKIFIASYCAHRDIVSGTDQPIEDVIMEQLKRNNLVSLSRNPQQLQLVCDYHRDHAHISGSLTKLYNNVYTRNCNRVLRVVKSDARYSKDMKKELFSDQGYDLLLTKLENLALFGFLQCRLIHDERTYQGLIGEMFVELFVLIGCVYFENVMGSETRVIGFHHKSWQEYFGACCIYRYLVKSAGPHSVEVGEALSQWKHLSQAVKYERMFVFMAGMAENVEEAQTIIGYITDMIKQLPSYYALDEKSDLHDLEDLPRQLALMQTRCVLQIKASGKCEGSPFLLQLLNSIPYKEGVPLPDINVVESDEHEVPSTMTGATARSDRQLQQPVKRYLESEVSSMQISPNPHGVIFPNVKFTKVFWIRLMAREEKTNIRVDCLAMPNDVLRDVEGVTTQGDRQSFFTPGINTKLHDLLTKHVAVDITMTDCSMADVADVTSVLKGIPRQTTMLYATTCHIFTVLIDSQKDCDFLDCHMDNQTTMNAVRALQECKYEPFGTTLCLQRWCDIGQGEKTQLLDYIQSLQNLSSLRLEHCKLTLVDHHGNPSESLVVVRQTEKCTDFALSTRAPPEDQQRKLEFTQENWEYLNNYVRNIKVPTGVQWLNILVLGLVGHGKSSFVMTCHNAMNTDKEHGVQEPGRVHIGDVVTGKHAITKRFQSYRYPSEKGQVARFRLCDTMGIGGDAGISPQSISLILRGHCKDGSKLADADAIEDSKHYRKKPTLNDRIHCVAVCVDAVQILNTDYMPITDSLPELKDIIHDQDINMYVLVTKIDNLCEKTDKDTKYALNSPEITRVIQNVTAALGIQDNKVYPIRNYVKETTWDLGIEVLALNAVKTMLDSASSFVKSCLQDDIDDE